MSIESILQQRADHKCELCSSDTDLKVYELPASSGIGAESAVLLCSNCYGQVKGDQELVVNHWHCLNDSMWSQTPAVQVLSYRILHRLNSETWAQDLLEMLYLDDELMAWAKAGIAETESQLVHRDSNGVQLQAGDTVVLIKDLPVKGAGFTAKRGTAVRNIGLASEDTHIEGRVNGQRIMIKTEFVKKQ